MCDWRACRPWFESFATVPREKRRVEPRYGELEHTDHNKRSKYGPLRRRSMAQVLFGRNIAAAPAPRYELWTPEQWRRGLIRGQLRAIA